VNQEANVALENAVAVGALNALRARTINADTGLLLPMLYIETALVASRVFYRLC